MLGLQKSFMFIRMSSANCIISIQCNNVWYDTKYNQNILKHPMSEITNSILQFLLRKNLLRIELSILLWKSVIWTMFTRPTWIYTADINILRMVTRVVELIVGCTLEYVHVQAGAAHVTAPDGLVTGTWYSIKDSPVVRMNHKAHHLTCDGSIQYCPTLQEEKYVVHIAYLFSSC